MMTSYMKNLSTLWELPSPKTLSYWWGFGSLLGILMVIQVASGLILAFCYSSGFLAWLSVVEITREVYAGWLIRSIHSNTASFVFFVMFMHFFRGIIQSSFYLGLPWISGFVLMLLTMAAAFLGYVLPWGQMSFWGATVIINLLSILPYGKMLVVWLWGGFYVSAATCSFFFALHYIIPFAVLMVILIHLFFLHFSGSTSFGGMNYSDSLKVKFGLLFSVKDMVNIIFIWAGFLLVLSMPDLFSDPVNFLPADLSSSPVHIQPEWYFLHFYAVLRAIPNKVGGLVMFFLAIFIILLFSWMKSEISLSHFLYYDFLAWSFVFFNFLLIWLGSQPVEDPFIGLSQFMTLLYFSFFFFLKSMDFFTFHSF
uniref:Cytochrome b n=2 Tax=Xiphinema TaxID=46002 RepID=A0A1P8C777_9BILA|nr:cytochrome b [Xiphinema rivesi]AOT84258.1 cytochrome b [Xiphinema rivesi]